MFFNIHLFCLNEYSETLKKKLFFIRLFGDCSLKKYIFWNCSIKKYIFKIALSKNINLISLIYFSPADSSDSSEEEK